MKNAREKARSSQTVGRSEGSMHQNKVIEWKPKQAVPHEKCVKCECCVCVCKTRQYKGQVNYKRAKKKENKPDEISEDNETESAIIRRYASVLDVTRAQRDIAVELIQKQRKQKINQTEGSKQVRGRSSLSVKGKTMKEIAERYKFSVKYLYELVSKSKRRLLIRKKYNVRRRNAFTTPVELWLEKRIDATHGMIDVDELVDEMKAKFGFGSRRTVMRLTRNKYRRSKLRMIPTLTPAQKEARERWATLLLGRIESNRNSDCPLTSSTEVIVHVDEKWFEEKQRQTIFVKRGTGATAIRVASKTMKRKIMFLGALACPILSRTFDGHIGLYPLVKETEAKRTSKMRKCGTKILKTVTMKKKRFIRMLIENVIPDTLKKVCQFATKIIIQMDSAGGHGGGRASLDKSTTPELQQAVKSIPLKKKRQMCPRMPFPEIVFVAQPAKSPEFNVLDLGAWNSMQVAVRKMRPCKREDWIEQIVETAKSAWEEWCKLDKISSLFELLEDISRAIIKVHGDNSYEIPHRCSEKVTQFTVLDSSYEPEKKRRCI